MFSGSGSVGIEALSRGAGHATFVDLAKDCCEVCLRNANICGFDAQAKAVRGDVMDVSHAPFEPHINGREGDSGRGRWGWAITVVDSECRDNIFDVYDRVESCAVRLLWLLNS